MVILSEIVIGAFLWIAISHGRPIQANPNSPSTEDLQDEYYTVTPAMTDKFVPQDDKDAKIIFDSNKSKTTIAGILPHREKVRRYAINIKMAAFSDDHKTRWFSETYKVGENLFDNLCFGLIEKEATVLGIYLHDFLTNKDNQRIGFVMVLTKDTHDMITTFDSHFDMKFDSHREELGDPCKIMVKNWADKNREPLENDELIHDSITKDANFLHTEHSNGGWKRIRTQLDRIFFQKSIKYARAVITEFEKLNNNKAIEEIISSYGLDDGLASTYRTFARYIKNKRKFIAEILLQYSDGSDNWALWIMCMAVIHPQEWPKVDEVFKQCNKGTSLTKFITERKIDKTMAEMMAVIIDPSFKPTQS